MLLQCNVLVGNTGLGYNIRVYGFVFLASFRVIHSVEFMESDMETVP